MEDKRDWDNEELGVPTHYTLSGLTEAELENRIEHLRDSLYGAPKWSSWSVSRAGAHLRAYLHEKARRGL
jgi:hypothetical protein